MRLMGIVVLTAFTVSIWVLVQQRDIVAERTAERKARETSDVAQCFEQVANAPRVSRILNLIGVLADNSIAANRAALTVSSPDDPLRTVREQSIARLIPARADLREFIRLVDEQTPTKAKCVELADRLGVEHPSTERTRP